MKVIIASLLVAASAATADTVQMRFTSVGAGRNVNVSIGSSSFNCFAGQLNHNFSNGTGAAAGIGGIRATFCSDLTQAAAPITSTFTLTGIQNLPVTVGYGPMGASKQQAVYDLYAAANGAQLGSDADMAAAFQLALWEVIYDYSGSASSLNLASGQMKAGSTNGSSLNSSIASRVSQLFAAIGTNVAQTGLLGFSSGQFQDQILQVQVVPLPAAAMIGILGLGVAGVARRRMTR